MREGKEKILSEARCSPSPAHQSSRSPPASRFWPQTGLLPLGLYQPTFQGFGFPPAPLAGAPLHNPGTSPDATSLLCPLPLAPLLVLGLPTTIFG